MKIVDLEKSKEVKELVKDLEVGDPVIFVENRIQRYILIDANSYSSMYHALIDDYEKHPMRYFDPSKLEFDFVEDPNRPELTLEEYEKIKKQLNEALEKNLKPTSKYKLTHS